MNNDTGNKKLLNKLSAELDRLDAQYDDIAAPSLPAMQQFLAAEAIADAARAAVSCCCFGWPHYSSLALFWPF